MGLIKKIADLMGKEISDDISEELEKELHEFKKIFKANRFLENIPNLELESYELPITVAGVTVSKEFKTKIEHKKVHGLFLTHRVASGGVSYNRNSRISIKIDRDFVFNQGLFHCILLEKTEGLTIYETAWRTDIDINVSDVAIEYSDGSTVTPPYSLYVHLICKK